MTMVLGKEEGQVTFLPSEGEIKLKNRQKLTFSSAANYFFYNKILICKEIQALERKLAVVKHQVADIQNGAKQCDETTSQLEGFSQKLTKKNDEQFLNYESRNDFIESVNQLMDRSNTGINDVELSKEDNIKMLNLFLKTYNDMLSLDITFKKQIIEIRFTNINKNDPQKEFVLVLNVGYSFTVKCCCPKIEKIDKLLLTLNLTSDWHSFVVSVRKHFMNTVK